MYYTIQDSYNEENSEELLGNVNSCFFSLCYTPNDSPCFSDYRNPETLIPPLLPLAHEVSSQKGYIDTEQKAIPAIVMPEKVRAKKEKKVFTVISEDEVKRQERAERNRQYAKESRARKKELIESLQAEVIQLKHLVTTYSSRLSKYELVEKYSTNMAIAHSKLSMADYAIPQENIEEIKDHFKRAWPDAEVHKRYRRELTGSWERVKVLIKDLVVAQRKIQLEIERIANLVNSKVVVGYDKVLISSMQKFMMRAALKPEIVNYGEGLLKELDDAVERTLSKEDKNSSYEYDSS